MSKYFTACRRRHPQLFFLSFLVNGGVHPLYSLCIPHSFFPENEESVKTLQVSFTSSLASLTPSHFSIWLSEVRKVEGIDFSSHPAIIVL